MFVFTKKYFMGKRTFNFFLFTSLANQLFLIPKVKDKYFLYFYSCIRFKRIFHLSLSDASHIVQHWGNFLFRATLTSRSNLSYKSIRVRVQRISLPFHGIARNGPPRRHQTSVPYRSYASRYGRKKRKMHL